MKGRATYTLLVAALAGGNAAADDGQQIRVDAGMSAARVPSIGRSGVGMIVEIKGYANDMLSIGGRIDIATMFGGRASPDDDLEFAMVGAAIAKAEVYLMPGVVRPFVSAGAGAYTVGAALTTSDPNGTRSDSGRFFGIAPQIGVDVGRLRLAATYNRIFGADIHTMSTAGASNEVSQSYVEIELSFAFATPSSSMR